MCRLEEVGLTVTLISAADARLTSHPYQQLDSLSSHRGPHQPCNRSPHAFLLACSRSSARRVWQRLWPDAPVTRSLLADRVCAAVGRQLATMTDRGTRD
jgi:hypothetical protein